MDDKGWSISEAVDADDDLQIAYASRRLVADALAEGVSDRELASLTKRLNDCTAEIKVLRSEAGGVEEGIPGSDAKEEPFDPTSI